MTDGNTVGSGADVDVSGQKWGSDFVADLLKAYEFEYVPFNPGASFRGIEESIVNYNDNDPEVITSPHEELSVSIAHGYAKATGEPSICILHDIVGTLNGTMGIYNAYIDQVPIVMLGGNGPLRKSQRRPWIDWMHTASDQGSFVRDFVKWDDQPAHSDGVAESFIRGYNIADTFPKGPVYVTIDHDLQENELEEPLEIPDLDKFAKPSSVAPERDALERAADMLVEAEFPVIFTGRIGNSQVVVDQLVELAETLGAAVIDTRKRHRYNFPNRHPLNLSGTDAFTDADVMLALNVDSITQELTTPNIQTHEITRLVDPDDFDLIDIGGHDLEASSLTGDYFSLHETTLPILGDVEIAIPDLLELVEERVDGDLRERAADRAAEIEARHDEQWEEWQREAEEKWDETPISVPRLAGEVWDVVQDEEFVLVNGTLQRWSHKLWDIDSAEKYIGGYSGGGGIGYGIGAAIGGALAYEGTGRVPINLQADGDLIQYPNGLWVLGHYDIPMLTVVHNNMTLFNSTNHRIQLADYRGRDSSYERAMIGTGLVDPVPDYASAAESFGVNGYGPIEDPDDLGDALRSALADVKNGEPALVDVRSQDR